MIRMDELGLNRGDYRRSGLEMARSSRSALASAKT